MSGGWERVEKRSLEYLLRHLLLVRELEPDSEVRPWAAVAAHIGRCGAQLLDDHARKHPTIFGLDPRGWGGREAGPAELLTESCLKPD